MAARTVKDAKDLDTNELIYFKSHAKATYMSNGTNVEDAINNLSISIPPETNSFMEITYSELKTLLDNSELVPGTIYCITDYKFTSCQENIHNGDGTSFYVLVNAVTNRELLHNALAKSSLTQNSDSWELLYDIYNDTTKYDWADAANGRGVIYYMKDKFGNECPYDFKNAVINNEYTFSTGESQDGSSLNMFHHNIIKPAYNNNIRTINRIVIRSSNINWPSDNNVFGVNCRDIELQGDCANNIFGNDCYGNILGASCEGNTFGHECYNNTLGGGSYYNTFGNYCYNNTFIDRCANNTFGHECYDNTIDSGYTNTLGNYCSGNTIYGDYINFGDDCCDNTIGAPNSNSCYNITFGNDCYGNIFGHWCGHITLGHYCDENNFGKECCGITFGDQCVENTIGDKCNGNILGHNCSNNNFGNDCSSNVLGNDCIENTFGEYCCSNTFGNGCESNTFGDDKNNPKSYYKYIVFDNGNKNINLNCTGTTSSTNYYQNVKIGLGVNNTSATKTITDSNTGQNYETYYKPANSQTITV